MNFLIDAFRRILKRYANAEGFSFTYQVFSDGSVQFDLRDVPIELDHDLINCKYKKLKSSDDPDATSFNKPEEVYCCTAVNDIDADNFFKVYRLVRIVLNPDDYAEKINRIDTVIMDYLKKKRRRI